MRIAEWIRSGAGMVAKCQTVTKEIFTLSEQLKIAFFAETTFYTIDECVSPNV